MTADPEFDKHVGLVPCKFCGEPTPMTATEKCDACWEVHHRLLTMPTRTVRAILRDVVEQRARMFAPDRRDPDA